MKRILITGATGFCGRYLTRQLSRAHNVYTLARGAIPGPNHIRFDLTQTSGTPPLPSELDAIIHCASTVDESSRSEEIYDRNILLTRGLVQLFRGKFPYLINLSSVSVYGKSSQPVTFSEKSSLRPDTQYARSKADGEEILSCFPAIHLRSSYMIGPQPPQRYFFVQILKRVLQQTPIELVNPDSTVFNFIALSDIARTINECLENPKKGTFNLVSNQPLTLRQVFEELVTFAKKGMPETRVREDLTTCMAMRYSSALQLGNLRTFRQVLTEDMGDLLG